MSTASKVLIGLIFVLALPSIYLAAKALQARSAWNRAIEQGRDNVEQLE